MNEPSFHVTTLGCKVNTYESEAVGQLLEAHGYRKGSADQKAQVHIINTCAVTQVSEGKSRQMIRRAIQKDPEATIVVMGCYSQLEAQAVKAIPGVDIVIGTSHRHEIPQLISTFQGKKEPIVKIDNLFIQPTFDPLEVTSYSDNTRAFLKIQDGCNNYCTFCIIPVTRGRIRSRSKDAILEEAQRLVTSGFKEIVLTGIHTAGYGDDLKDYGFSQLIQDLAKTVPDLRRLRISSIEASQISDELIALMAKTPMIVDHLHIPIQSGSDSILERMRRKYKTAYFREKVATLRHFFPNIAITTDVIVGFPGETEKEFLETYQFIEEIGFSTLHVFPYSTRRGTLAASMKNQVSPEVKKKRVGQLMQLSERLHFHYASQFIQTTQEVLVESFDSTTSLANGFTSNYLKVTFPGTPQCVNQLVKIKIEKIQDGIILGYIENERGA